MRRVYLDNGSTSFPKAPGVGQAMFEYIENAGFNVSRGGYRSSYDLAERILDTREKLRDFFGFDRESNVIFTPNVTFSLNYVIRVLNAAMGWSSPLWSTMRWQGLLKRQSEVCI